MDEAGAGDDAKRALVQIFHCHDLDVVILVLYYSPMNANPNSRLFGIEYS